MSPDRAIGGYHFGFPPLRASTGFIERKVSRERMMAFSSHEEYFDSVAPEVRPLLVSIQKRVETLLPEASRCISYSMPAFRIRRVFFFFAAFKKHIGIYPPVTEDVALVRELAPYRGEKGNLSFPLNQPLPIDLIGRVAVALSLERGR